VCGKECAARNLKKSAFEEEEQKREMREMHEQKKSEKTRATMGEEEEEEEKPFRGGPAIKKRRFTPCCDEGIAETRP
jgi:hypothetical protein